MAWGLGDPKTSPCPCTHSPNSCLVSGEGLRLRPCFVLCHLSTSSRDAMVPLPLSLPGFLSWWYLMTNQYITSLIGLPGNCYLPSSLSAQRSLFLRENKGLKPPTGTRFYSCPMPVYCGLFIGVASEGSSPGVPLASSSAWTNASPVPPLPSLHVPCVCLSLDPWTSRVFYLT